MIAVLVIGGFTLCRGSQTHAGLRSIGAERSSRRSFLGAGLFKLLPPQVEKSIIEFTNTPIFCISSSRASSSAAFWNGSPGSGQRLSEDIHSARPPLVAAGLSNGGRDPHGLGPSQLLLCRASDHGRPCRRRAPYRSRSAIRRSCINPGGRVRADSAADHARQPYRHCVSGASLRGKTISSLTGEGRFSRTKHDNMGSRQRG